MRFILAAASLLIGGSAYAQPGPVPSPFRQVTLQYLTSGTTTPTLPADVSQISITACALGGSGGGGQSGATQAGAGGGGAGQCLQNYILPVTAGQALSVVIPATGGTTAIAGTGTHPNPVTISGAGMIGSLLLQLDSGLGGLPGAAATGGAGGAGGGTVVRTVGGAAASAGGSYGSSTVVAAGNNASGGGGGGGGSAASAAGRGGIVYDAPWVGITGQNTATGGGGNASGGGGGSSLFGVGQAGTADGVACSASPTWVGYGGGGCGGGSNNVGGPGGPGFVQITYFTSY